MQVQVHLQRHVDRAARRRHLGDHEDFPSPPAICIAWCSRDRRCFRRQCSDPEIIDAGGDATFAAANYYADLTQAWFEADAENVYLNIELTRLDAPQPLVAYFVIFEIGSTARYASFAYTDDPTTGALFATGRWDEEMKFASLQEDTTIVTGSVKFGSPALGRVDLPRALFGTEAVAGSPRAVIVDYKTLATVEAAPIVLDSADGGREFRLAQAQPATDLPLPQRETPGFLFFATLAAIAVAAMGLRLR